MKRFLSVWLPDWPLTRLRRAKRGQAKGTARLSETRDKARRAFVLVEAGTHGLRVAAANEPARRGGVHEGLRFTDARARIPDILSEEIDRQADALALRQLADWLVRISPLVAIDGSDGLMLETTGCAHLHDGEDGLMQAVSLLLSRDSIPCRIGVAGTPGAAGAIARGVPGKILADGEEAAGLADLPVSLLRVSDKAETLLRRFGLTRIGQLYGIDRRALARRFQSKAEADLVVLRLDQALGLRNEPIEPLRPLPDHVAHLSCPEPLLSGEGIRSGLRELAVTLCDELKTLGQGARGFCLSAYRSDGSVKRAEISLSRPSAVPDHICRLFAEEIDFIDPGFGIDLLALEARRVGALNLSAPAFSGAFVGSDIDEVALSSLADRISARLGEGAVRVSQQFESHIPERSEDWVEFTGQVNFPSGEGKTGPRPIRIFVSPERLKVLAEVPDGPPQRFVWRKIARSVVRADGPERISPEWWRHVAVPAPAPSPDGTDRKWLAPRLDPRADAVLIEKVRREAENIVDLPLAVTAVPEVSNADMSVLQTRLPRARDYYRIEDEAGRRYWVFREGLYDDGRGGAPEWYIHGVFA